MKPGLLLSVLFICALTCFGQPSAPELARQYRRTHEHQILSEFVNLLRIPNVASDNDNIRRNATFILMMMNRRGLNARLLESNDPKAPPAIYGEWITPGATRTLVFYAHYDGQPTDARQWTGSHPWEPMFRSAPLESGGNTISIDHKAPVNPQWSYTPDPPPMIRPAL